MKIRQGVIYFFTAFGLIAITSLFAVIIGGLVYSATQAGLLDSLSAFSLQWAPIDGKYGVIPMVIGSFTVATVATLIAIPLAFGILWTIWVYDNRISRFFRGFIRFISGIPTVVYGFCGLFLLIPLFRSIFGGSGYNILTVSLVLSLLILPTIVLVADSALYPTLNRSEQLPITAASLGLNNEKTFLFIALYVKRKFLITAILLGFSRALGDTMIALMLSGNTPITPDGLLSSVRVLSAHIKLLTATEITPQVEFTMFLSGFILFTTAMSVSIVTKYLRNRC